MNIGRETEGDMELFTPPPPSRGAPVLDREGGVGMAVVQFLVKAFVSKYLAFDIPHFP